MVTQDIVINIGVLARPEIPRLLFGVIRFVFQAFELVFKVY
jgi:hypothetical protein